MEVNKIALVLDTCILEKTINEDEDMSLFGLSIYDDTVDLIERNELQDNVEIFIPRIVLDELLNHKENKLKSRVSTAKKLMHDIGSVSGININFDCEVGFTCKKHISEVADIKIKNIKVIEMPDDKGLLFQEILEMSILKIPPFKQGDSDHGFKDAIILKSIEDLARNSDFDKFTFFTKDKGFNHSSITKTFEKNTGKKLEIVFNKNIQGYISNLYPVFPEFKNYLNNEFLPKIEEQIEKLTTIAIPSEGSFEIIKSGINDFELDQINEDEYNINIGLKIAYKNNQGEIKEITDIVKPYNFKRNSSENEAWVIAEGRCNYYMY